MCYQKCRYEYFNGECSLESDPKPPIDAMCHINDLGAEIAMLRDLVFDCHALLQHYCDNEDEHGSKCPMTYELRPCPFCGSEVAPYVTRCWDEARHDYNEFQWQVVCNFNKGGCGGSSGVRGNEHLAIELWNRRVDQNEDTAKS